MWLAGCAAVDRDWPRHGRSQTSGARTGPARDQGIGWSLAWVAAGVVRAQREVTRLDSRIGQLRGQEGVRGLFGNDQSLRTEQRFADIAKTLGVKDEAFNEQERPEAATEGRT